jgi:uncharacterized protein YecE (DUF72 family)
MTRFWVGVSGFSYASWIGEFYPKGTMAEDMLEAYSAKLNSVEINSTFYHMPTKTTTSKWADSTPEDFRFSFKANRRITHFKKLKDATPEVDRFLNGLSPLQAKLSCVLIQLPPYLKADYDLLETFLSQRPAGSIRFAFEFRHSSWFTSRVNALLSKYDAALCAADTEDMKPVFERTAEFAYTRLRHDAYSKDELKNWSKRLREFAGDSGDCFVYFKHDETGKAANMAAEFDSMLNR